MKKTLKSLLAAFLVGATALSAASCDTVKKGSVIKTCTVTIGYDGDKEQDVIFELYMNFAPATIEHFSYLAENGYYDNSIVSNLDGYMEFGAFSKAADGSLVSKYNNGEKGYYGIITDDYAAGKTVLGGGARYYANKSIYGEFSANGIGGNKLDFTGSLVLKRDYSENISKSYYNTGKGTMAITFSTSSYFGDSTKYAILGKLSREDEITVKDADGNDKTVTSNDFVYSLLNDYKVDKDDDETYSNTYYYFNYDYSVYPYEESDEDYDEDEKENYEKIDARLAETGRCFMKNKDGVYYYKDGNGAYTVALDSQEEEDKLLIEAFKDKSLYLAILPYKDIVIKKIVIEK